MQLNTNFRNFISGILFTTMPLVSLGCSDQDSRPSAAEIKKLNEATNKELKVEEESENKEIENYIKARMKKKELIFDFTIEDFKKTGKTQEEVDKLVSYNLELVKSKLEEIHLKFKNDESYKDSDFLRDLRGWLGIREQFITKETKEKYQKIYDETFNRMVSAKTKLYTLQAKFRRAKSIQKTNFNFVKEINFEVNNFIKELKKLKQKDTSNLEEATKYKEELEVARINIIIGDLKNLGKTLKYKFNQSEFISPSFIQLGEKISKRSTNSKSVKNNNLFKTLLDQNHFNNLVFTKKIVTLLRQAIKNNKPIDQKTKSKFEQITKDLYQKSIITALYKNFWLQALKDINDLIEARISNDQKKQKKYISIIEELDKWHFDEFDEGYSSLEIDFLNSKYMAKIQNSKAKKRLKSFKRLATIKENLGFFKSVLSEEKTLKSIEFYSVAKSSSKYRNKLVSILDFIAKNVDPSKLKLNQDEQKIVHKIKQLVKNNLIRDIALMHVIPGEINLEEIDSLFQVISKIEALKANKSK